MSEAIQIDYNGHQVTFREDDDEWRCWALKLTAKSLTALKRKIDKLDSTARRVAVSAMRFDHSDQTVPCIIVMIAKPKDWDRASFEEQREGIKDRRPTIWVLEMDGNKQERRKVALQQCFLPTESNLATLAEARKIKDEIERLQRARSDTLAMIPRLTLEDLAAKGAAEDNLDETD